MPLPRCLSIQYQSVITAVIVLEKDNKQHSFQPSNIEFSQFKNSLINRCLFKFRLLHSALQSDVFLNFVHIVRLILHFIYNTMADGDGQISRTVEAHVVAYTCKAKIR